MPLDWRQVLSSVCRYLSYYETVNQCLHNSSQPPKLSLQMHVWELMSGIAVCLLEKLDQQKCLDVGVDEVFVDGPKTRGFVLYIVWKGLMSWTEGYSSKVNINKINRHGHPLPHCHTVKMFMNCITPPLLIIVSVICCFITSIANWFS